MQATATDLAEEQAAVHREQTRTEELAAEVEGLRTQLEEAERAVATSREEAVTAAGRIAALEATLTAADERAGDDLEAARSQASAEHELLRAQAAAELDMARQHAQRAMDEIRPPPPPMSPLHRLRPTRPATRHRRP